MTSYNHVYLVLSSSDANFRGAEVTASSGCIKITPSEKDRRGYTTEYALEYVSDGAATITVSTGSHRRTVTLDSREFIDLEAFVFDVWFGQDTFYLKTKSATREKQKKWNEELYRPDNYLNAWIDKLSKEQYQEIRAKQEGDTVRILSFKGVIPANSSFRTISRWEYDENDMTMLKARLNPYDSGSWWYPIGGIYKNIKRYFPGYDSPFDLPFDWTNNFYDVDVSELIKNNVAIFDLYGGARLYIDFRHKFNRRMYILA